MKSLSLLYRSEEITRITCVKGSFAGLTVQSADRKIPSHLVALDFDLGDRDTRIGSARRLPAVARRQQLSSSRTLVTG
jgi:hypothetical protein